MDNSITKMGNCETKLTEMKEDNVESYGVIGNSMTSNDSEDQYQAQVIYI